MIKWKAGEMFNPALESMMQTTHKVHSDKGNIALPFLIIMLAFLPCVLTLHSHWNTLLQYESVVFWPICRHATLKFHLHQWARFNTNITDNVTTVRACMLLFPAISQMKPAGKSCMPVYCLRFCHLLPQFSGLRGLQIDFFFPESN